MTTRKERHSVRPPVRHTWSLPGARSQLKKPFIFQHELLQNFSISLFCKVCKWGYLALSTFYSLKHGIWTLPLDWLWLEVVSLELWDSNGFVMFRSEGKFWGLGFRLGAHLRFGMCSFCRHLYKKFKGIQTCVMFSCDRLFYQHSSSVSTPVIRSTSTLLLKESICAELHL